MSLETSKYARKVFNVDAIQVSPLNIAEVAEWCGGSVQKSGEKEGHPSREHIKLNVANAIRERQTKAYYGDWVLRSGNNVFKVYTNSAFRKSFREA